MLKVFSLQGSILARDQVGMSTPFWRIVAFRVCGRMTMAELPCNGRATRATGGLW